MTPELRSNMAAPCVASEVAVSVKAENSIISISSSSNHVAPLHHCVQVWMHTLNPDGPLIDLILEASPLKMSQCSARTD